MHVAWCDAGVPLQDIVICCDGSWCGGATETTGNIQIIANSIAWQQVDSGLAGVTVGTTIVYYFDGVGVDALNFSDYLLEGALATDIRQRCVEAYAAIVRSYSPGVKIWMFGMSRGAFTARSVAGMINNLGVLRRDQPNLAKLCNEVYSLYRNRDEECSPTSVFAQQWRHEKSHDRSKEPPIR